MTRILRCLINGLTLVSLVLLVVVLALWARSYRGGGGGGGGGGAVLRGETWWGVRSAGGEVSVGYCAARRLVGAEVQNLRWRWDRATADEVRWRMPGVDAGGVEVERAGPRGMAGLPVMGRLFAARVPARFVRVSWFVPAVLAALMPCAWAGLRVRAWRVARDRRRRRVAGLCPACGYDMRGSPERCPECGSVA